MLRRFQFNLRALLWLTAVFAFYAAVAAKRASTDELMLLESIAILSLAGILVAAGLFLLRTTSK